jgi:vanillate O-demethylase monooxygenase subunit
MEYLRNTWYVAAWADEVSQSLFPRMILDEPIVFYRTSSGKAAAIEDRCPHRFVPLHRGRLVGDNVECGYHGLQFDCSGQCVVSPFDAKIPKAAKVKSYPLEERYGIVWIWMGDPDKADADLIHDFSYLLSNERRVLRGGMTVKANYELLVDNVADLTHTHFLHSAFLHHDAFSRGKHEVIQEGNTIHSKFSFPNGRVPPIVGKFMDNPDLIVDRWTEIRWNAPAVIRLDSGATLPGQPRSEGIQMFGTHLLTPETQTTTHYFYAHARAFKLTDPKTDEVVREWQRVAFNEEDKPMIEAQQQRMKTPDLMSLKPILLSSDAGAVRIRRTLARLIEEERMQEAEVEAR